MDKLTILALVKESLSVLTFFRVEEQTGADTIKFFEKSAIRILKIKKCLAIEVQQSYCDLLDESEVEYKIMKNDWVRIELSDCSDISKLVPVIIGIYNDKRANVTTESFGCCNSFKECSDNLACLYPNDIFYLGCMYRKNLEAGRIFYGKNATVKST